MWRLIIQSSNAYRRELTFSTGKLTIGRGEENDIVFNDQHVSRNHAEIYIQGVQPHLRDLNSTNGTFVNGKQVDGARPLEPDDKIRIGLNILNLVSIATKELSLLQQYQEGDTLAAQRLLFESLDNYAVIVYELEKSLSRAPDLESAVREASEFISRMISANICEIILQEDFDRIKDLRLPPALKMRIIGDSAIKMITDAPDPDAEGRSILFVPVRVAMRVEALIFAERTGTSPARFDLRDLQLVVAASHAIAMAIQQKRHEVALLRHANYDSLTRLPNRNMLIQRIQHAIDRAARDPEFSFALFFLDINEFKLVNDSLGHPVGDELLVSIGKRLQEVFRESDTIARYGGDEFAVLYTELLSPEDAPHIAESVIDAISRPFNLSDKRVHVSVSIGVALSSSRYRTGDEVIRDADIAMYRAKEAGENAYEIFDAEMREQLVERINLHSDLRNAIRNQEFQLYYQPIISLREGRPIGLEALIRWNSPRRGFLKPGEFMKTTDTTGLLRSIDDWVLETACRQIVEWESLVDTPLYISVNLSNKQFNLPTLADKVAAVLEKTSLPPEQLWLEITENTIFGNEEEVISTIQKIKSLGVHFSLDDFGRGYSTFSYLYRLPFDNLKIDRTFIKDLTDPHSTMRVVQLLINLAASLRLKVIAEGIETPEQLTMLRGMDCDYGQGYYFSEPLPSSELEQWIRSGPNWTAD